MEISEEDYLAHYGTLRKSGRYPWGSGEGYQEHHRTLLADIEAMRAQGLKDTEIARGLGMTTTEFRTARSIAKNAKLQADIAMAQRLKEKGYSNVAGAKRMGIPEPTFRTLLEPGRKDKAEVLTATSSMLRDAVKEKQYVDIGAGVELHMAISKRKLTDAVALLKNEGYAVHSVPVEQLGTGNKTTIKVLAAPGTSWGDVYRNREQIKQIMNYSEDGGRSFDRIMPPISIKSHRVAVRYAEQGGTEADGVIYVRPGVKDVSLDGSHYAQVRIAVDGTHYLKGMAVYKDDLPPGVDLMFNTNKSDTGNKLDAMKPMQKDPENPFGALIKRQIGERNPDGTKKLTSVMNLVNEEGDWEKWSKTLSSQMLSKQSPKLAAEQLGIASERRKNELDSILGLENPSVRQKLLRAYADGADSAAENLKAAALPRQGSHVILPVESMKPTEVYAPRFRDGEPVVLIRHPHGGKFEIPELRVNNRNPEAKKLLGNAKDAIGIHSSVAERLSGADFDGDTVLVIPNPHGKIKSEPALEDLKNFDPKHEYPYYEGMKKMDATVKGFEMGIISNLITDMTIKGAPNNELARAVRHSMVVIDAEKHGLNWKQSAIDNGIAQLKRKYQKKHGGATTIISRASSETHVPERKPRSSEHGGPIDKVTGEKMYEPTGASYVNSKGKLVKNHTKTTQMAEAKDARDLSSGTPIEEIYAAHANKLKALANKARLEMINTKTTPYSPEARVKYANEVETLDAKLNLALRNSPLERQAQVIANTIFKQKKDANPDLDKDQIKKLKTQALTEARIRVGAQKKEIEITPQEWEAIQSGAITPNRLSDILDHADLDKVKQLATPKVRPVMSDSKKNSAVIMLRNGYSYADVADHLGVSVNTLMRSLSESDT